MYSIRNYCQRLQKPSLKIYFSSSPPEIVIPPRVERGPTDILSAIAGTVGKDLTAPNYRYHDDPWLIPYKIGSKRDYSLAKESGRKSAHYIMSQHPDLFDHNRIEAEPPITAFQPRVSYNRDNVTIELLDNLVDSFQVQDSIFVFNLLTEKKKTIPEELYQRLMELVAYYNESEAVVEGDETRGITDTDVPWRADGFVVSQYSSGGEATPGERMAMLLGQAKHGGKVWQLLSECRANGDRIPVEAYNFAIERINQTEGINKAIDGIKELLVEMMEAKVAPNNATLISILSLLAQFAKAKDYEVACRRALDFLAEFRVLEIEFSLGVYKMLLDVFSPASSRSDKRTPKSPIVNDILNEIETKEFWPAKHPSDFWFFPMAMKVCNVQNNAKQAWRVNEYLQTGKNSLLLSDFQMETIYYTNFLSTILQNDSFEKTIQLYNDLVPHTCTPMWNFYSNLLNHLHTNAALQHLPKVWEDLLVSDFGSASKENQYALTNQMMQLLLANDPSLYDFTGMSEVYITISSQVFQHLEENKANKRLYLRFNTVAANICNNIIKVSLREGNFEQAVSVVKFCVAEKNVMPGHLKNDALEQYLDCCIDLAENEKAIEAVEYSVDINSSDAVKFGLNLSTKVDLTDDQKVYVNKLFATYSEWVNL